MIKICLDPGHGRRDNHIAGTDYYEGTQMFKLAQLLLDALSDYPGIETICTRLTIDDDPTLLQRGNLGKGCDLFLSLHSNAPGSVTQTSVHGVSIYDTVAFPNTRLAEALARNVAEVMSTDFRAPVNYRRNSTGIDWYGVLRYASKVGCQSSMLLEHGFHTNPAERAWLMEPANLKALAQREAAIIAAHYGLTKTQEDTNVIYCQKGQGSVAQPDAKVFAFQTGLSRLSVQMKNDSGVIFQADGSFGGATANGVEAFEVKYGLPRTNGESVTDAHLRVMLVELQKLDTGITPAQLAAAKAQYTQLMDKLKALII